MDRFKLAIAIATSLVFGAIIGGTVVYLAIGDSAPNPSAEFAPETGDSDDEIAKWRRSSIDWETGLLRHQVIDATYKPTKTYMTKRIAAGDDFLSNKISFDEFTQTVNELDQHARNTGVIHVVDGEDFGYRMQ